MHVWSAWVRPRTCRTAWGQWRSSPVGTWQTEASSLFITWGRCKSQSGFQAVIIKISRVSLPGTLCVFLTSQELGVLVPQWPARRERETENNKHPANSVTQTHHWTWHGLANHIAFFAASTNPRPEVGCECDDGYRKTVRVFKLSLWSWRTDVCSRVLKNQRLY